MSKLHISTDIITESDIRKATTAAGMTGVEADVRVRDSRSKAHKYSVRMTASWDEMGMFINALYDVDPDATIGFYKSRDMFHAATVDRFRSLTAERQHKNHKWVSPANDTTQYCDECEAESRLWSVTMSWSSTR